VGVKVITSESTKVRFQLSIWPPPPPPALVAAPTLLRLPHRRAPSTAHTPPSIFYLSSVQLEPPFTPPTVVKSILELNEVDPDGEPEPPLGLPSLTGLMDSPEWPRWVELATRGRCLESSSHGARRTVPMPEPSSISSVA
jgi:hypothetical protein